MKLLTKFVLLFAFIILVSSLQLTTQKEKEQQATQKKFYKRPYYGKHYRNHRSEEYLHRVKEDNLKKIQEFNDNNKKRLKSGHGGGSSMSGGHSFIMGETKFIEFTQEQFIHLFTGYKAPASHSHLLQKTNEQTQNSLKSKIKSQNNKDESHGQRILFRHFLGKLNQNNNQDQIQSHYQITLNPTTKIQNRNNEQHNQWFDDQQYSDDGWQFDDPWDIDGHYLSSIYGDVNDGSNWGWDWQSWDSNYYSDFSNDYEHYWTDWETDHWNDDDGWWSGWFEEQENNQDNNDWWFDDGWGNEENIQDSQNSESSTTPISGSRSIAAYPESAVQVNWNLKSATTHIKQQGQCGSCWSFSTIGIVESYFLIMGQGKMDLSEQQLVDCQKSGSFGCDGGWPHNALQFASTNGLVAQEKYPYKGVQKKCAHPTGPRKIPKSSQVKGRSAIQSALRKGPVSAALYVDDGFQFYKQGIFDKCIKQQVNHAIIIVGFTNDYWIVRNSWGADWGEAGHIRIKRSQNNNNACSIQDYVIAINY